MMKMKMTKRFQVALAAGSFFVLSAAMAASPDECSDGPIREAAHLGKKMGALRAAIDAEIGVPTARSAVNCGVLAIGSRPCGGPSAYLVYSASKSDARKLAGLSRQYTEKERRLNQLTQAMSVCIYEVAPTAVLVNGTCRRGPDAQSRNPVRRAY